MRDIYHDLKINASPDKVFEAVSTAAGLDNWRTKTCIGDPLSGAIYHLGFGEGYQWTAEVTICVKDNAFELLLTDAHKDWKNTRVGFMIKKVEKGVLLRFYHVGWSEENDHFKNSVYCWAMYLRVLKKNLELGQEIPYENRYDN